MGETVEGGAWLVDVGFAGVDEEEEARRIIDGLDERRHRRTAVDDVLLSIFAVYFLVGQNASGCVAVTHYVRRDT